MLAAEKSKFKRGQVKLNEDRHKVSRAMDLAVQFCFLAILERRGVVFVRKRLRLQASRLPRAEFTPEGAHEASDEIRAFLTQYQAQAVS